MTITSLPGWQSLRRGLVQLTVFLICGMLWTAQGDAATTGDINNDGTVNIADALMTLRYIVGLIEHTPTANAAYLAACDVSPLDPVTRVPKGNGTIDIADALGVLRHVVNLDSWTLTRLPLTRLEIATSGITPGVAVDITFSNPAGYLVKKNALLVSPDGTLSTGVPVYIDPATQNITAGTVNIDVSQTLPGGTKIQLNPPIPLTIENLPVLTAVPTGQISRAFLTSSALLSSLRLSAYQFFETNLNGKLNTTAARDSEKKLLQSIVKARNSIDGVIQDPSTVIILGNAADGTPLQFTSGSLALMDRMIAVWLSELPLGTTSLNALSAKSSMSSPQLSIYSVNAISQELATLIGLKSDMDTLQSNGSTMVDKTLAFSDAIGSLTGSNAIAGVTANAAVLNTANNFMTDWSHVTSDAVSCLGSPGSCAKANSDADALLFNGAGQLLSAYIQAGLNNLNTVSGGTLTGPLALGAALLNYFTSNSAPQADQAIYNNMPSLAYGGFFMGGTVQVSGTSSSVDLVVPSTTLCAGAPFPITGMTDANGTYVLAVPSNQYCSAISTLNIQVSDPLTEIVYGSEVVDLRGMDTSKPVTVPLISYTLPSPENTCCACNFDVYCTVFGQGGCWKCQNMAVSGGECQAPYGYLTSPGFCSCDPGLYQVCQ